MAFVTEITQPLRVFTSTGMRSWDRSPFPENNIPLICASENTLIPILLAGSGTSVSEIILIDANFGTSLDITSYMSFVYEQDSDGNNYLRYFADSNFDTSIGYGNYYLKITTDTGTVYTDYFSVVPTDECIKVEFYHDTDIGYHLFSNDFKYFFYINTSVLTSGEYKDFKDNDETKFKDEVIYFQRIDKLYESKFISKEGIGDALWFAKVCDYCYITDRLSNRNRVFIEEITPGGRIENTSYFEIVMKYRLYTGYTKVAESDEDKKLTTRLLRNDPDNKVILINGKDGTKKALII